MSDLKVCLSLEKQFKDVETSFLWVFLNVFLCSRKITLFQLCFIGLFIGLIIFIIFSFIAFSL